MSRGLRERLADRALGDLVEGDPARLGGGDVAPPPRRARRSPRPRGRGRWRGRRRPRPAGRLLDRRDLLAPVLRDDVLGREVVVHVDAELALARVLGQVPDVAVRGEDLVVRAEVALDGPRLGGRFHDHEVLGHGGRECSTGPFAPVPICRGRAPRRPSDVADALQEVLVDLEVDVGSSVGRRRSAPTASAPTAAIGHRRRLELGVAGRRLGASSAPRASPPPAASRCAGRAAWGSRGTGSRGTGRRTWTRCGR